MSDFDLIVIGGGPAGYVAAIRAAQLGMKTACVEKRGALGGTCLNVGCIPSKALLHSSELYEHAKRHGAEHGIKFSGLAADVPALMKRKDEVVTNLTKGIEGLFKKNKIEYIKGHATITGAGKVDVDGKAYGAKNILIATGSSVMPLAGVEIDEKRIVSSTGGIALSEIPKKLVIIGAGVIGLELGSVWRRLGSEVVVVEYLDRVLPTQDSEVSKHFQKIMEKQGMSFKLSTKVIAAKTSARNVALTLTPAAGGAAEELVADYVLVAIGRKPNTEKLGLDKIGMTLDSRGRIEVDGHFETSVKGIFAIGDVIPGPMLAHKAEEDGVAAVECMAGQRGHVNYNLVPGVVYTYPEVASIGQTEEQLKAEGRAYKIGKFPFMANSRARAMGATDGFVKILADATSDLVLGVHIIGAQAGTIIGELAIAMEFGASSEDIARTCHSHPDLNEAVKEAALAVLGRAIHI